MDVPIGAVDGGACENAAGLGRTPFRRTDDLEDEVHGRQLVLQHSLEEFELLAQRRVARAQALDLADRVQHSRMVASTEAAADLRQRTQGQRLRQIHRHLTRLDYDRGAPRGQDVLACDAVMTRDELLYVLDLDPFRLARADEIADRDLRGIDCEGRAADTRMRHQTVDRALEIAAVRND